MNISQVIRSAYSSRPIIRSAERDLFFSEIDSVFCKVGQDKLSRKLVFCLAGNDIGGLAGYFGLLISDAVPLMLSASLSSCQLSNLIKKYRPSFLWLPEVRKSEFLNVECVDSFSGYCLLDLHCSDAAINDSLALLLATSGSTGSPRFVRLSKQNVLSNASAIAQYLELNPDEIPITTLPPSYSYGLSIINSHITVGATIALTNKTFFDRAFWDFLRSVKASSIGGVPYHYEILKKLRFSRMDLPSLRTFTQAGGRMQSDLTLEYATHCLERGMRFFTMYGQTEATARMSYLPSDRATTKAGSIGVAMPGGKFRLENEHGRTIQEAGIAGELVYEGANVSMGYADGYEDLVKEDEFGGILRTGDLAKRDIDGDYYIVGRLKRFIKLFGHRINLVDVENYLLNSGYDVACSGQDDRLEVYFINSSKQGASNIRKILAEYLQVALSGIAVYGVNSLPRNEFGKIKYAELTPLVGDFIA